MEKLYSALGKIEQVVHVNADRKVSDNDLLQVGKNDHAMLATVSKVWQTFNDAGIEFYVFVKGQKKLMNNMTHTPAKFTYLLPLTERPSDNWTQDQFDFLPWQEKFLHVLPPKIATTINTQLLSVPNLTFNPKPTMPGGNLLFGQSGNVDYLLTMIEVDDIKTKPALETDYEPFKCITIDKPTEKSIADLLYHIDLFLAILGPVNKPGLEKKEMLLLARAVGDDAVLVQRMNDFLDPLEARLKKEGKKLGVDFEIVRVNMDVFSDAGEVFFLPVMNCLVENYVKEGKRQIRLFIPEFTHDIVAYIATKMERSILRESQMFGYFNLKASPNSVALTGSFALSLWQVMNAASRSTTGDLVSKLGDLGIEEHNIIPVSAAFRKIAKNKHAGLHCLVKVVKRS